MAWVTWRKEKWYAGFRDREDKQFLRATPYCTKSRKDKRAAEDFAEELEQGVRGVGVNSIDVETGLAHWLESNPNWAETTQAQYKTCVRKFLEFISPKGQKYPLQGFHFTYIEDYRNTRLRSGISPNCTIRDLKVLRTAWNWMMHREWTTENPAQKVDLPGKTYSERQTIPMALIDTLIEETHAGYISGKMPDHWYALTLFGGHAAMRKSEIINMRKECINLEDCTLYIEGKSVRPRIIPISPRMISFIKAHLNEGPWLLPSNRADMADKPIGPKVGEAYNKWLKPRAGITHHSFRHSLLNALDQAGLRGEARRRFAGHEDEATAQIYLHSTVSEVRQSLEILGIG